MSWANCLNVRLRSKLLSVRISFSDTNWKCLSKNLFLINVFRSHTINHLPPPNRSLVGLAGKYRYKILSITLSYWIYWKAKRYKSFLQCTKIITFRFQDYRWNKYFVLLLICQISAILLVEIACIFLIVLISTVQISMECETPET